jgi:hypothetical protein
MDTITTQPPVPESKYAPFTLEEFQIIQAEMNAIGVYLPSDATAQRKLWQNCVRIRGKAENQPCSCKSSAGLWVRCIDDIKGFIKARS